MDIADIMVSICLSEKDKFYILSLMWKIKPKKESKKRKAKQCSLGGKWDKSE